VTTVQLIFGQASKSLKKKLEIQLCLKPWQAQSDFRKVLLHVAILKATFAWSNSCIGISHINCMRNLCSSLLAMKLGRFQW
jgi:hypothetical protein